jgi:hypothetical protein
MNRAPIPHGKDHQWRKTQGVELVNYNADQLQTLASGFAALWDRVAEWTDSGFSSSQSDVAVSGGRVAPDGSENGRTPALVLRRLDSDDQFVADMHVVLSSMVRIGDTLDRVMVAFHRLQVANPEELKGVLEPKRPIGEGYCINKHCNHYSPGGLDRRRAERCEPCYRWWKSHDRTERPHENCASDRDHPYGCEQCERVGATA